MVKYIILLIILFSSILVAQPPPERDGNGVATFSSDGIWRLNMELICTINFPAMPRAHEMLESISVETNTGTKQINDKL